jgi:hypothetical protein
MSRIPFTFGTLLIFAAAPNHPNIQAIHHAPVLVMVNFRDRAASPGTTAIKKRSVAPPLPEAALGGAARPG